MISEESTIQEVFQFPSHHQEQKRGKLQTKAHRNKRNNNQTGKPLKWSFIKVVKAVKNVSQFIDNLKKRQTEKGSFKEHTLKAKELQYLDNDSQSEGETALFSHDNKLIQALDILFIGIMLLYFWQCTYEMVLGQISDNEVMNGLALGSYLLHILLQQLTEIKNQKAELITNLYEIRQKYRRDKLFKDFISITVLGFQITPLDNHQFSFFFFITIRLLSLLTYLEMSQTCEKVEQNITLSILGETIISFLKLLYKVFIFLHFISLILNWVATLQNFYGMHTTWLTNPDISYNSNLEKYILGWYWGATILSTVGFGDIVPYNNVQRFIVSLVQVCCCMCFGYFVNTIGEMIKVRSQSSEKYVKEVRSLNRFLSLLTISNDLKHKIRTHYFNKNLVESMHDPKEQKEVLQTITPNLKTSLLQEVNIKLIKKCSQFQKFRSDTINRIAQSLKRTILAPQYLLYSRNSTERKIWFIQNGTVQEFTDKFSDSKLRKIVSVYHNKEPLVGWINFVTPGSYRTLAKAKNFTVTHQLDLAQFLKCISQDCRDFFKFAEIKQLLIEKSRKYDSKCLSCGRYTHNVVDCPRIHLLKKEANKLYVQKKNLNHYIKGQDKKLKRSSIYFNWKLFGCGQLQREAKLLTNNTTSPQAAAIDNCNETINGRTSQRVQQRRLGSFLLQQFKERQADKGKLGQVDARPSLQRIEQEVDVEFQKVLFNKEHNDYFPTFDIENVLNRYNKNKKQEQAIKKHNFFR